MLELTKVMKDNNVNIVGAITSLDITDDVNKNSGVPVKRGTITVKVGESSFVLHTYMAEKYNSGKANASYALLNEMAVGSFASFSCQLDESKFVPAGTTDIARNYRIKLNFINKPRSNDVEGANFVYGGVVLSPLKEVTNKEGEVYRYDIMIGQPEYRKPDEVNQTGFNTVRFNVDPRNSSMIDAVRANLNQLDTVKISGSLLSEVSTTEIVEEALFGEGRTITYQNVSTVFNIEGALVVPEHQIYTEEQITALINNTKLADAKLKEEPKNGKSNVAKTNAPVNDPLSSLF